MLVGLILMEEVERTNMVMINLQQQWTGFAPKQNPYTINVDKERNCYNCRGFKHIVKYYRNQKMVG